MKSTFLLTYLLSITHIFYAKSLEKRGVFTLLAAHTKGISTLVYHKTLSAIDPGKNADAQTCFNNKSGVPLVKSTDLEGKNILAFPLDKLRSNVRYGFIENYKQGFARIKKDQVWGFLNLCGEEVIPSQYEQAEAFNNGKALVKKHDWFFVDALGNESDIFQDVKDAKALANGISWIKLNSGKCALINNSFDKTNQYISPLYDDITPISSSVFAVKMNNKWGLWKIEDKSPVVPNFDLIAPTGVNGLIKIKTGDKIGLANTNGDIIWPPQYGILTDADANGFVKGIDDNTQQLINTKTLKISKVFKNISDFDTRGLAIVQSNNNLFGIINKDFTVLIEPQYTSLGSIGEFDLLPASKEIVGKGVKFGFINLAGQDVIPFNYEAVGKINKKGMLVVKEIVSCNLDAKGSKIGTCKADKVIDVNGGTVVLPITKYPDAGKINYTVTDSTVQNCIVVKAYRSNEKVRAFKYILVREDDFKVITPEPFEQVQTTAQFLFVKLDGLWGTLDFSGKYLAKCQFKNVAASTEGFYLVQHENSKFGYVDTKGKIQIPPEYTFLDSFNNGLAIASKGNNQIGLINKFNAKVAPCIFTSVVLDSSYNYDLLDTNQNRFKLNKSGDCLTNCAKFDEVRSKVNKDN
ncbi:WG repeat-containing protein [Flectobacillus major]|uniref:WG repeat-containing protein n=1 Tax=Flectobacillus major TaxID=103 RepID=UPI000427B925|nr:WG repeat-containing protein [Flectobacillus major]